MSIGIHAHLLLTSVALFLLEIEFIFLQESVANPRYNVLTSVLELQVFKADGSCLERGFQLFLWAGVLFLFQVLLYLR